MFEEIIYRWRLHKLEIQSNKIQKEYTKQSKGLSGEELENIRAKESSVIWPVLEDIDSLISNHFRQIANKLLVPLPDKKDNDLWEKQPYHQRTILSTKGIWELKKLIRREKHDKWEFFFLLLASLIGIIGAFTGLAAVLIR